MHQRKRTVIVRVRGFGLRDRRHRNINKIRHCHQVVTILSCNCNNRRPNWICLLAVKRIQKWIRTETVMRPLSQPAKLTKTETMGTPARADSGFSERVKYQNPTPTGGMCLNRYARGSLWDFLTGANLGIDLDAGSFGSVSQGRGST